MGGVGTQMAVIRVLVASYSIVYHHYDSRQVRAAGHMSFLDQRYIPPSTLPSTVLVNGSSHTMRIYNSYITISGRTKGAPPSRIYLVEHLELFQADWS